MNIVKTVIGLSELLPTYSESRMPYTYHHDKMRQSFPNIYESRADVARAFSGAKDDRLYAIAFMYLLENESIVDVLNVYDDLDMSRAKLILEIAKNELVAA